MYDNLKLGIYIVLIFAFIISILERTFPKTIPFGLSIDLVTIYIWIITLIKLNNKADFSVIKNSLTLLWALWMMFITIMILNPLSTSAEAWFYAMRSISLYPFIITPLVFLIYNKKEDMYNFIFFIAIVEIIATLWGMKQLFIGVSASEQAWLNAGADRTHILFGKLRVFSFFSDSSTFAGSQAHIAIIAAAFGLTSKGYKRWVFFVASILGVYGLIISGSRGPIAVIVIGVTIFLISSKNYKLLLAGFILGLISFGFLKFTRIMQSNYQINRMRTALNPSKDPSYLVRKRKEKVVAKFLSDKPIGGGIGSAGSWGMRFSPGTFLASTPTDGYYARIWMETGIIGLLINIILYLFLAFKGLLIVMRIKNENLRLKIASIVSAFIGLAFASYFNAIMSQNPTGIIVPITLVFVYLAPKWDKEIEEENKLHNTPQNLIDIDNKAQLN